MQKVDYMHCSTPFDMRLEHLWILLSDTGLEINTQQIIRDKLVWGESKVMCRILLCWGLVFLNLHIV